MTESNEYVFTQKSTALIAFGIVAVVFGAVVFGFAFMIEMTQPGDEDIWIVRAAAYAIMGIGVLMLSFRHRGLLDGNRRLYIREWGFGLMFYRKHIPFDEFSYVVLEAIRPSMRTVYQVCLARKQDKIGRFNRVDIGNELVNEMSDAAQRRGMKGLLASGIKGLKASRHQAGSFVLYSICGYGDVNDCRREAEEIARLIGASLHERIGDGNTKIRTVD